MAIGLGFEDRILTEAEVREVFRQGLEDLQPDGKRLIFVIPDGTRSVPIPLCFRTIAELLQGRVAKLDMLLALGTHKTMDEDEILRRVGITAEERSGRYADIEIINHDWQHGLKHIGTIPGSEISELTGGLMDQDVPVSVNARIFDYDHVIIVGPVFPHEVVGFSGGNKYFFPGIAGADVTNLTHWLAGLVTNLKTIGQLDTPVRRVLDRAASFIDMPKSCFSLVVRDHHNLAGVYYGSPEASQRTAAELSAKVNVRYLNRRYRTVVSVMPHIYDDFWTACKGMFKMEHVVEDGGTLIIYAPWLDVLSYTHGAVLDRIGYHVKDYYLAHDDEYEGVNRLVMGHATLTKGTGTYVDGVETPRINVVLATGLSEEHCRRINLGYIDPESLDLEDLVARNDTLVVPRAGEQLHLYRPS